MNPLFVAILQMIVAASVVPFCSSALAQDLLIRDVIVVSATRINPFSLTNVVIRNGLITRIGVDLPANDDEISAVLEGKGRFLTPGLIDGHTHLAEIPGMRADQEARFPAVAKSARWQIPRSYLYHGFTTVVDLNSNAVEIENWNSREIRPTAYFCGAAPVFDGYPMRFTPKPLRYQITPYFLYDESRADEFPLNYAVSDHQPAAVADQIKSDGGICVKTHYETGFGGSGDWPVPTIGLIRTLVNEAHQRDMPVLLHANSQEAQQFGLDADVDAIVHGMWTWNDRNATDLNVGVTHLLNNISDKRIGWQATIQVLYGERDLHDPNYFLLAALKDVLPVSLIEWYQTEEGQWWRNRLSKLPKLRQLLKQEGWQTLDADPITRVTNALYYLANRNSHLLFGSDTPSDPTYANPPGLNGRLEMQRWVDSGVTATQIFRAATLSNAAFFGLQDSIGAIEVGMRADLLLLASNPLTDISAFDDIDYVILEGRAIPRVDLSAREYTK